MMNVLPVGANFSLLVYILFNKGNDVHKSKEEVIRVGSLVQNGRISTLKSLRKQLTNNFGGLI